LAGVLALTPALTSFELYGFDVVLPTIFDCRKLEKKVEMAPKSAEARAQQLFELLSKCVHLENLQVAFKNVTYENIQIKSPLLPGFRFSKLKSVSLGRVGLSDVALATFVTQNPVLETLLIKSEFSPAQKAYYHIIQPPYLGVEFMW
jgi:hypothetical protein